MTEPVCAPGDGREPASLGLQPCLPTLLSLPVPLLRFELLALHLHRLAVVAGPFAEAAAFKFQHAADRAVQEPAVMRHEKDGRRRVADPAFQPLAAGGVQVVGRFIQEQCFRWGQQQRGEHRPTLLTAGQAVQLPGGIQAEAAEDRVRPRLEVVAAEQAELFFGRTVLGQCGPGRIMERLAGQLQPLTGFSQFRWCNAVQHGATSGGRLLGQHGHVAGGGDAAVIRGVDAGQDPQESALATAVAADQCRVLALAELKGNIAENPVVAERTGDRFHGDTQNDLPGWIAGRT